VVPRFVFTTLLSLLAVLVVSFGALMGGFAIATSASDTGGAQGFWWLAMGCLLLLIIDCVLLLGALGIEYLERSKDQRVSPSKAAGEEDNGEA
jgi:hypothetical protein